EPNPNEARCQIDYIDGNWTCSTQPEFNSTYNCVLQYRDSNHEPFCMSRIRPPTPMPDINETRCQLDYTDDLWTCSILSEFNSTHSCILKYRNNTGEPFCMSRIQPPTPVPDID